MGMMHERIKGEAAAEDGRSSTAAQNGCLIVTERIGSGNDRDCWRHPLDPSRCIKIAKLEHERPQNAIDLHYARYLAHRGIRSWHIPRVYGWVMTNHGRGLVFELIQDPDGSPSQPLLQAFKQGKISRARAVSMVDEGFAWLIAHHVILADYGPNNLLVQRHPDGSGHLVFVDGLGARDFGIKYWMYRTFAFKAVRKARLFHDKTLQALVQARGQGR